MQPAYAAREPATALGSSRESTRSEMMTLPPGLRTRYASAKTLSLAVERLTTQLEMTASTELSPAGRFSISPRRNSTLPKPPFRAFSRAFSSISGVMSTPITRPDGPTARAARKQSNPAPDPRSRTVSPSAREARATGLPHPSPRLAPCGTAFSSSSEYPIFRLAESGVSSPVQQAPGSQHEPPFCAMPAYRLRTAFRIFASFMAQALLQDFGSSSPIRGPSTPLIIPLNSSTRMRDRQHTRPSFSQPITASLSPPLMPALSRSSFGSTICPRSSTATRHSTRQPANGVSEGPQQEASFRFFSISPPCTVFPHV